MAQWAIFYVQRELEIAGDSHGPAAEIDARIADAWASHPQRFLVESSSDFLDKAARALEILRGEIPDCCRRHVRPALRDRHIKADEIRAGG